MKAQKIILILIALLLSTAAPVLSQTVNDPDKSTGEIKDYSLKSGRTQLQNIIETDEYGLDGANKFLGGLGTDADYVSVTHHSRFNQAGGGSIEAWVYMTDLSEISYILAKGAVQANSAYVFYINTDGRPAIRSGNINLISNGETVPLNTWTHVAVTWDDQGSIEVLFYIDGLQTGTTITTPGNFLSNTDEIRIGSAEFGSEGFSGYIDEVRFWGVVITQEQIRSNRFVGLGEKPASNFEGANFEGSESYPHLISSWTFNSGFADFVWEYMFGSYGIKHGSANLLTGMHGYPLPYNNVLYFPSLGGDNNFVEMRDSTGLANILNPGGTIEMWVRMDDPTQPNPIALISKGATSATSSFYLGIAGGNTGKLVFRIGNFTVTSTGPSIPRFEWFHTAVSWVTLGAGYTVKFYINGELNDSLHLNTNVMPLNSDVIRIGKSEGFPGAESPSYTYIDELKIWGQEQAQDTIKKLMFASASAIGEVYQDELLAAWGFDGDLVPTGRFKRMRGTFNVGTVNRCRFNSYFNDYLLHGNVLSSVLYGHNTVMKSEDATDHAFPLGFYHEVVFDTIPAGNPSGLTDVINVGPSFPDNNVSSVDLFVSAEVYGVGNLELTLTAPNGVSRTVTSNAGSNKNHILTIFNDDAVHGVNSTEFMPPWSNGVRPSEVFGNFGNSPARGNWTLNISLPGPTSSAGNFPARLLGWGIRLNDQMVTGLQQVTSELPGSYELSQNYPNPFNPSTSIKFSIPQSGLVTLKVYDILGKEVATLVNEELNEGVYEHNFDASALPSGVYFYKLESGSFREVKKMLLVK